VSERTDLAETFEEHRPRLRAVAYRMLGSFSEADDAVQETWIKFDRTDVSDVRNLSSWLNTVAGRVCLDMLRSRASRREDSLDDDQFRMPDPVVTAMGSDPEESALLRDSVGMAMMLVLQALEPPERLAYVLHDLFSVPFDQISDILGRTPVATRQMASRARRRIDQASPDPEEDPALRRQVADAFIAASRAGDFDGLLAVLDPDVVARSDGGKLGTSLLRQGAREVASGALFFARLADSGLPALVNGEPGAIGIINGQVASVLAFTIRDGKITALDILTDPERLAELDLSGVVPATD
jgi:RNA polymerase sigma-70 factor (ECF subfamily)